MTAPRLLVVIPTLNEAAYIEPLVTGLSHNCARLNARIVVADGGSSDGTIGIINRLVLTYPNVSLLHNPGRLQSAAINLAVSTYGDQADFLIRMDAHADYPDDYIPQLIAEQKTTNADSVCVPMETVGLRGFQRAVAAAQNSKLGNGGSAHRQIGFAGKWVDHGHHALMRIAAFRAVNGYDENFSHNEDAELDTRLRQAGYTIWLTGKTSHTYYPRTRPGPLFRQYFKYGQGRARTILKHKTMPRLRQIIPVGVAPAVLLFFIPIHPIFMMPALIWMMICLIYGAGLGFRAKEPIIALSGPATMIMHLAWSLGFWRSIICFLLRGRL